MIQAVSNGLCPPRRLLVTVAFVSESPFRGEAFTVTTAA